MALMYPPTPREYKENSLEGLMFDAFKQMSDEYMVFHSMTITTTEGEVIEQSETDFIVFHPEKGILCVEAKAGRAYCEERTWYYGNGDPMPHDGPFCQASNNMFNLMDYFTAKGCASIKRRCKFLYAVWFPSVPVSKIENFVLPPNAPKEIILTKESFDDIEKAISDIFDFSFMSRRETNLSKNDVERIVNDILAPSFDLVSLVEVIDNHRKVVFKKMLKEQVLLLNYLEEQNNAVINGLGGTGKTIMAIEKARKHSIRGEKVLFLCYNKKLKEYLKNTYPMDNVYYYTIDGFACYLCNTQEADYSLLKLLLETMYCESSFPFQHVIIDEGQDFGRDNIEECDLISLLKDNVIDDESKNGTFYMFYDKNQMVQSRTVPAYIQEADCRLTLYRNCRNTKHIATTSLRFLNSDKQPKLFDAAIEGNLPNMAIVDSEEQVLSTINELIDLYYENGYKDICILTCKTEERSILSREAAQNIYLYKGRRIFFTSCRKFKGLEADVIILIDIEEEDMVENEDKNLYVGASRAKYELAIVAVMSEDECKIISEKRGLMTRRNFKKAIATSLNSKLYKIGSAED